MQVGFVCVFAEVVHVNLQHACGGNVGEHE